MRVCLNWDAAQLEIVSEQGRPERQGLFGLLSIGFGAAAVLTVLGFLLYALFSFRRRFIELGVLRASGLSSEQMTSFLAWELIFLIVIGGAVGTGAWRHLSATFSSPTSKLGQMQHQGFLPILLKSLGQLYSKSMLYSACFSWSR